MQIKEFSKPITSTKLNENVARTFGVKLNLEQFTDVQLEDVRNKLRTEMSQFEVSESFDAVIESPKYQKTRALLDVINQAILEREMNPQDKAEEKKLKKKFDKSGMKQNMKKQYGENKGENIYFATIRKKAMDHSVPESWIDSAIERIQLGESDQEELSAELTLRYDLTESQAHSIVYLSESEENKAEIIMATKDMVDRITGWLEDVATMKAEQLLELIDSIRETQGSDVAQAYQEEVKPALEAIYTALETSRQGLSTALSTVSGGEAPTMGSAPLGGETPDIGAGTPEMGDMGGAEAGLPGGDLGSDAGRMKRESVDYSRRLSQLLNAPKKK